MALLTKKRGGTLADLSEKLDRSREQLATVEATLVVSARTRAEAFGALAEEDLDPVSLVERRSEISAGENALIQQRDALLASIRELGRRCATLAVQEAEERVEKLRMALVPLADERSRVEDRLVGIAVEEGELHEQIADAVDRVRWSAAEFDDAAHRAKIKADAVENWRPLVRNPDDAPRTIAAALKAEPFTSIFLIWSVCPPRRLPTMSLGTKAPTGRRVLPVVPAGTVAACLRTQSRQLICTLAEPRSSSREKRARGDRARTREPRRRVACRVRRCGRVARVLPGVLGAGVR